MSVPFEVVVAADEARGIGRDDGIPWRLPGDSAFFRKLTSEAPEGKQNAVIMGRKTYESLPPRFRPLPRRLNIVLTRGAWLAPEGVCVARSLEDALALVASRADVAHAFVIGGGEIYAHALTHPRCVRVHVTRVEGVFACDTRLPPFEDDFRRTYRGETHEENGVRYAFETYERLGAR